MLERAPQAWGHTGELQRFTCLGWPGERLRRLLLGGRGLERGVGRSRLAGRQRLARVVVGQRVLRSGVGGGGRRLLLLRLLQILQANEALGGTALPRGLGRRVGPRDGGMRSRRGGRGERQHLLRLLLLRRLHLRCRCARGRLHDLRRRHDEVLAEPHALAVRVGVGQVEARGRGPAWRVGHLLARLHLRPLRCVVRRCARGDLAARVARRP
mmetsp:Transcript_37465/g.95086  ORF Transcript_37465/g.95086 Transcript_37465/m.95086 type:complete len:212 (+) Transcript_37465:232-867(+)